VLDAIDYYTDSASDGGEGIEGIVVFAAGNDNSNADYYPGFYEKTVAVAVHFSADVPYHYQWTGEACQAGDAGLPAECA